MRQLPLLLPRRKKVIAAFLALLAFARAEPPAPPEPEPTPAAAPDPGCFRGGPTRLGSDGSAVPDKLPAILWKYRDPAEPGRVCSTPVFSDGRIFFGTDSDAVYCLDTANNGKLLWKGDVKYWVFASPVVADGKVLVGEGLHTTTDAKLYAFDKVSGKKVWEYRSSSHIEAAVTVVDGRAYFSAGDDGMLCVDVATGKKIWQAKGMHIDSAPLVHGGIVVAGSGYGDTKVTAWSAETGEVVWSAKTPSSAWGPPAIGPKGILVATGNGNFGMSKPNPKGAVLCLSSETGATIWSAPLRNASLSACAVSGDKVYVGDRSGDFSAIDGVTGKLLWKAGCGQAILGSAAVASNAVVIGCGGGHVHAYDPETGKEMWKLTIGREGTFSDTSIISSPLVVEGRIYIGSNNGSFYCIGAKK